MRLRCPGCKTWLCDDEELNDDGDEVPIEMEHISGGRWAVTEIEHTPDRCRTASGVAALVDAARDLLDYVEIVARRQREETGLEMAGLRSLADSLRAALGALR